MTATPPQSSEFAPVDADDRYAWIADPAAPEVAALLAAERAYYDVRTASLHGLRAALRAEMTGRVPESEPEPPWDEHGHTYRWESLPGADHPRLVRWPLGEPDRVAVLLDLDELARETATGHCQAGLVQVSPDGRWLAWSVDLSGDEVYELRFRDLLVGEDLGEVVHGTMETGAWASGAFLYTRPDDRWRSHQVWRHALGSDPVQDVLVAQEDDERFELWAHATRSGAWVILESYARDTSEVSLLPTADPAATPRLVRARRKGIQYFLEHDATADRFLVLTNDGASEFRIAAAAADEPGEWLDLIAGRPDERPLEVAALAGGLVVALRSRGAGILRVLPREGEPYDIAHPTPGGLVRLGRNPDPSAPAVTVVLESFTDPTEHVDVDLATGTRTARHRAEVVGVDPAAYVTERRTVAHDGVEVPVVIVRHRDTALDGRAPCLLYGYGAYEATCEADWGIDWWRTLPSLLDRGVVFAVGQPRGGGECGRRWWEDGHLRHKPHTFDDQAAVADHLADGLVDPRRIVTRGLSAGGLLQGALYGRRPDRWAGVLAEVPFVDVITTMLDASLPLTATEWDEWGDPRDPGDREVMESYSPMENRPPVDVRPPLLVTGAVHDTRVLVREPARWVARLRDDDPARGAGVDPVSPVSARTVLFRVETGAGSHGGPTGRFGQLEYEAEVLAWVLAALSVS